MRTLVFLVCLVLGCQTRMGALPTTPDPSTISWIQHRDNEVGYSLSYPDVFEVEKRRGEPFFSYGGPTFFRVIYITPSEAKARGLWGGHEPVADVLMGGRTAHKYVYRHVDFNVYRPMVAFVVEHHGKQLGIEFPMQDAPLDAVRQQILDSVRF